MKSIFDHFEKTKSDLGDLLYYFYSRKLNKDLLPMEFRFENQKVK